jgi:peptide deformylase
MNSPFLKPYDPRLSQPAQPVDVSQITGEQTQNDLAQMFAIARPEQDDHSQAVLVGVSASQIGIPRRIVLIDVAADGHGRVGDLRTYINPVIVTNHPDVEEWYEGCYSTAPICGIVARPRAITITAFDAQGQPITEQHQGYVARIFQHEIDHLDGLVFIDPQYRDQEGWRNWTKKSPSSYWADLKLQGR